MCFQNVWKAGRRMRQQQKREKIQGTGTGTTTRQQIEKWNQLTDSPDIPVRGKKSEMSGLPLFGACPDTNPHIIILTFRELLIPFLLWTLVVPAVLDSCWCSAHSWLYCTWNSGHWPWPSWVYSRRPRTGPLCWADHGVQQTTSKPSLANMHFTGRKI